ncbi:thymidine kinase [Brumimicrobium sp.]|uniref:thymidine kinase n=1 Tax=Brumimicrobium sp. TaxID=2029867 RepID=UPI003A90C364
MFLEQFPEDGKYRGWIEVICGSMFSGKTEELIRRLRRINFAGQDLLLFKPRIDKRYSEECVVSHNGATFEAIQVDTAKEILNHWSSERIVAIDEAQFFDEDIVRVANHLASNGVRVICAGLDMDFQAKPFGPMPFLMASAEYVTKVHAICMSCGNLAQFSHRKTKEKEQVLVGAVQEYEPLCRGCYNKIKH